MKKATLVLLAVTFLAESQAEIIKESQDESVQYIISNLRVSDDFGFRYAGGSKNQRAASFFTHGNYYGMTYQVQNVILHYDEWRVGYGNGWGTPNPYRWARPTIYSSVPDGSGPDSKNGRGFQGRFNKDEHKEFDANDNLVRMTPRTIKPLKSNRTYWLIFDTEYSGGSPAGDGYVYNRFYIAKDTSEYSPVGWTIGDDESFSSDEGKNYRFANPPNTPPLQFALHVTSNLPDPFEIGDKITPGNLAEANVSIEGDERNRGINNWSWVATPFYTASRTGTPNHLFRLDHVTMLNNIRNDNRYNGGEHVIAIYDSERDPNNWWRRFPGEEIGRFSSDLPEIIDGEFEGSIESDDNKQHRFHADPSAPILLEPWQRYWIVQKMENWNSGDSAVTDLGMPSFTRSKNADGWTIGDYYFRTHNRGQNWLEVNETHGAHNDWTMRFGFGATIVDPNQKGDINVDGDINVFDLILINDHLRGAHNLQGVLFDLGNINSDGGSQYITNSDRDLLLDLILEN